MSEETTLPGADEPQKPETQDGAVPAGASQEEQKVSDDEANAMADAFLATLIGKGGDASIQNLDQVKTASGRTYTSIAKKSNARLLVNVDLEPGQVPAPPSIATDKLKKVMAVAVVIRTLEAGVPISEFASAFPIRDGIDGDTGFLRGPKIVLPMCLMGPPDYIRAMWTSQKVTEYLAGFFQGKVKAVAGAELTATDEMLTMLIESRLDSMPTGQLFLFNNPAS